MLESQAKFRRAKSGDDLNSRRATGPWFAKISDGASSVPAPGFSSQRFPGCFSLGISQVRLSGYMVQLLGNVKKNASSSIPYRSTVQRQKGTESQERRTGPAARRRVPERRYSSRDRVSRRHSRYAAEKPSSTYPACGMDSASLPRKNDRRTVSAGRNRYCTTMTWSIAIWGLCKRAKTQPQTAPMPQQKFDQLIKRQFASISLFNLLFAVGGPA